MKKFLCGAILLCLMTVAATAQNYEVKRSNYAEIQLSLTSSRPTVKDVMFATDTFTTLSIEGFQPMGNVGRPNLPMMIKMLEVPICSGYQCEITHFTADTIDGSVLGVHHLIMPVQPSRSKSDRTPITLVKNDAQYAANAFYGNAVVSIEKVGIARDRNLATLYFCPISYNPVTNQFIIYKDVDVTIHYVNADASATETMKERYTSGAFNARIETINTLPTPKDVSPSAPTRYLIVAHSSFRGQLDSFIAWKQRKGFIVTTAYTDDAAVGTTTTSIAAYIKNQYTNATTALPAPTYVLLVGDYAQIPAFDGAYGSSDHVTDLNYMTWNTGDIIPDCYYGRFSAQNVSQLTPQIEKTLMYEQYTFPDPSFLDRAVLIAGVDAGYSGDNAYTYADPAMDYIAKTYLTSANGYTSVTYYKNNTAFAPTGVTVTGSSQSTSTPAALRSIYNEGAGWVNYSAHGDVEEWYQPSFTTDHVSAMTNNQKFGFMIGNCCLTNKFEQSECLGESLLRKSNYCGAVAYFGGSDYTYWAEDFYWAVGVRSTINNTCDPTYTSSALGMYDRLFHTHGESQSNWYTSAGAITMGGNMAVQSSSSSLKEYYWEIYHLMGDPSVMPWLTQASTMTVQASPNVLNIGATTLNVSAVPYAYVALTDGNGTLIAAAFADAQGSATLNFSSLSTPGTYEIAVSAQGYQTNFTSINIISADGPYILPSNLQVSNNGTLTAGAASTFELTLQNVGNEASSSYSVELQTNSSHLLIANATPDTITTALAVDGTATLHSIFSSTVWPTIADQTTTQITAIIRWGNHSDQVSRRTFSFVINAPKVAVQSSSFNGSIASNQTVSLNVVNKNIGHAALSGATATLISPDPNITVTTTAQTLNTLNIDATTTTTYALQLGALLPNNCEIPLYQIIENANLRRLDTIKLTIGTGSIETFESNGFAAFNWAQGTNPWITTNTAAEVYAGTYSARSKSNLANNASSDLTISWTSTTADSISFYYNVSSEGNYDFFKFYIDNSEKISASGTSNSWTRASFPVSAGTHTFKFSYSNDYSSAYGSDCAWIDNVKFPLAGTVRSYQMDTACSGENYTFSTLTINTTDSAAGTYLYQDSTANHLHFLLLTIENTPNVNIAADRTTIAAGESVLLTASGADHYLWATGEQVPQIRVYPTDSTTYTVTGYNGKCSNTASIKILVNGNIGILSAETNQHMNLYPNPTTGKVTVSNIATTSTNTLQLLDLYGRTLKNWTVTGAKQTLDITPLPKGVYILRCSTQTANSIKQ